MPTPRLAANIELLFADRSGDIVERAELAAAAGFELIEFWRWRNKDINRLTRAIQGAGLSVAGFMSEQRNLVTQTERLVDRSTHTAFLAGLRESIDVALGLNCRTLVVHAGDTLGDVPIDDQTAAIVDALSEAGAVAVTAGITIALEPLNTIVDHPGHFLHSTKLALEIIAAVDRTNVQLLYDVYHASVMGERTPVVLAGCVDRVAYVQIADAPGRQEPGTGRAPLAADLGWLFNQGYRGDVGLEYIPSRPTLETLDLARGVLAGMA